MTPTAAIRIALKASGFSPTPCNGKEAILRGWTTLLDVSAEEMAVWPGANTGIICTFNPVFDADILHPEAAVAVEDLVKDWFDGRGIIPVRIGLAPKRAMIFRTSTPFSKMVQYFKSPNGEEHKIEILGSGQQVVAFGDHPLTHKPYAWYGGCPGEGVTHADLVEVTEQDMRELLKLASDLVVENFGFELTHRKTGNGHANGTYGDREAGPVDVEAELQSMRDGQSVNAAHCRVIPSKLRKGEHPQDVLDFVVDETMARIGLSLGWTRGKEVVHVRRRILSGYNNKLLDGYDPASGVPDWLPGEFHQRWLEIVSAGGTPMFHYAGKFCLRARQGSKPSENSGHGPYGDKGAASGHKEGDHPKGQSKKFVLHAFVPFDLGSLPPREWLYGRHYQRRTVSATVAPGGFGKTTLCMVEGVAMATARSLLGEQPAERLRVWYHNGEDSLEELNRRLGAICLHYGIPQEELRGWFFMTSGNEIPLRVANGYGELKIHTTLVQAIEEGIATNKIDRHPRPTGHPA
jgi:hypothetical protein